MDGIRRPEAPKETVILKVLSMVRLGEPNAGVAQWQST
jgi:hypothetical protein